VGVGTLRCIDDPEADLIAAGQRGDRAALDRLLRDHHERIYGICRRITGNDADAADASQEAMIAVVRGLPGFDSRSRFGTWVYRVATNAALDEVRRRGRRATSSSAATEASPPGSGGGADPADPSPWPDERVPTRLDIDAALRQLPPEFRAAVVLRDLCGLDYREIAEILQIPPGTVRSRIARGRGGLVPLLAGNPDSLDRRPTTRQ
jgi:RNA polymerase sigma-70 factor, ECF subfamily